MNDSIIIRKASRQELDIVIELGEMLQNESKEYEPELTFDKQTAINHYGKEINNNQSLIIIAEYNSEIIGYQYSYTHKLDYLAAHNLECVFEAIYVMPNWRSKGTASKLISFSEDWAINRMHADRIKANIYTANSVSEKLHVNNGFTPHSTEYIKITTA